MKEGGIREPLIVYYPNVTKPSTINDTPVIIEDFYPTILELAGVSDYQTPQTIDGKSFAAQLKGQEAIKSVLYFSIIRIIGERESKRPVLRKVLS